MHQEHYTVSQVAKLTHLTVRALHHYDAIGLLSPSQRSAGGYRLYSDEDLRRLQQVLLLRELGFGLDAVRELIDAPPLRRREALLAQRALLEQRRRHADVVLNAVDATLQSLEAEHPMTTEKLFAGYEQFQNGEYAKEAEQRWGDTDAWRESQKRTKKYSREEWKAIETESETITADFLAAMRSGEASDGAAATAIAERHRRHIDRWFYPCSHRMQVCVASMYVSDPRFQDYYDRHSAGLAAYVEAAIRSNAVRAEGS